MGDSSGDPLLRTTVPFAPRNPLPSPRPPDSCPRPHPEPAPNRKLASHQTRARSRGVTAASLLPRLLENHLGLSRGVRMSRVTAASVRLPHRLDTPLRAI